MDRTQWRSETIALLLVLSAAALRLPGCFSELWLDEVWSLYIAVRVGSPVGVLTEFQHSNNHPLNTLVFYLLGDRDHAVLYRLHSYAAGVASVWLVFAAARPGGRAAGLLAALLCSTSYLLIHYASEARGYALVICLGLASFLSLRRFAETRHWRWALCTWLLAVLGFLSHLMYLHVLVAAGVWLPVRLWRAGLRGVDWLWALARALGPPGLFLALYYVAFVRPMEIGGGPDFSLLEVLRKSLSLAFGGPAGGPASVAAAGIGSLLLVAAFVKLWRQGRDEGLFFVVVILLSPAVVLIASRPDVLFLRYFLLGIPFGYVALAPLLAQGWRAAGWPRAGVALLVLLFLGGNALNALDLYRYGRGGFGDAVQYMAEHTQGSSIVLTSDHDFRTAMLLDYYGRFVPADKQLYYVPKAEAPVPGLAWMLRHELEGGESEPEASFGDGAGSRYELVRRYPCAGISCWRWFLYTRREG